LSESDDIFSTPESEARLDLIKHLIENSELVPLVRGMSGIGKSLLATRLQSSAPKNWAVCHFSADSMMQPERLLAQIARCNGLPDAKEDNIKRLINRFEMLRKRGTIPVLLIDDAQNLPPTSLITLLRLYERQVGSAPLVSLVLFADEQIDMLLSTPQLQIMSPQSIQVIDLPPLTREETQSYMDFLLKTEGLDRSLALDESRLTRIYRETQGAPGPLASAILEAFGEAGTSSQSVLVKHKRPLFWVAVPLVVVLLLLLVFQGPLNQLFSPDIAAPEGPGKVAQNSRPATALGQTGDQPQTEIILPKPEPPETAEPSETLSVENTNSTHEIVLNQLDTAIVASDIAAESDRLEPPAEENDAQSETEAKAAEMDVDRVVEPLSETQATDASVSVRAAAESGVMDAPAAVPDEPPEQKAIPDDGPDDGALVAADELKVADKPTLIRSEAWLRKRAPGSYTIQLLAVENIESIQPVILKYHLQGKAFAVRTKRHEKAWYPLLWGEFPDRSAAVEAIKQLAPELQKGGAWARPFASLQP
jgi:DamX protein